MDKKKKSNVVPLTSVQGASKEEAAQNLISFIQSRPETAIDALYWSPNTGAFLFPRDAKPEVLVGQLEVLKHQILAAALSFVGNMDE